MKTIEKEIFTSIGDFATVEKPLRFGLLIGGKACISRVFAYSDWIFHLL